MTYAFSFTPHKHGEATEVIVRGGTNPDNLPLVGRITFDSEEAWQAFHCRYIRPGIEAEWEEHHADRVLGCDGSDLPAPRKCQHCADPVTAVEGGLIHVDNGTVYCDQPSAGATTEAA